MTMEHIFTNGQLVTPGEVIAHGTLTVRAGRIASAEPGTSALANAIDLEGDYLLPGLVELHTDNLERHMSPRPGVHWPTIGAVLAHDAQMAAAGITTVLDALRLGDAFEGCAELEAVTKPLEAIVHAEAGGATRAAHFLHLRCEIGCAETLDLFHQLVDTPSLRLVSVMDHTPGQRQFVDPEKLRFYYTKKYGMTDAEFNTFSAHRIEASARYSARHRAEIVGLTRMRGRALASHDDATTDHVAEAVRDGMTVAEFPTTLTAARVSHDSGLAVMVGGPNLVLGASHSGNIAARELASAGCVDIVSSDYVPNSLMQAAFKLAAAPIGLDLPAAVRTVSLNPARSVGLDDRGALEPDRRADLVRVRVVDGEPVVRGVWRDGVRVV